VKGTVEQLPNGTWTWRFGYVDAAGKRRQPRGRGFGTEAKAWRAMREAMRLVDQGRAPLEPGKTTTAQYLARWLDHQKHRVRPSTYRRDAISVRDDIAPVVGHVPLVQLGPHHVEAVMDAMRARGAAPSSIVRARAVMSRAMRQALLWGLVSTNPVAATRPPKVDRPDLEVPDAGGLRALQAAAEGTPWEVAMLLATTLGTRRGETLGVAWEHVDLATGRVRVMRALQRVEGELRLVDLKTARARRTVVLPATAREKVRVWKRAQAETLLRHGVRQTAQTLLCTDPVGQPLDPDAFTHAAKRFARAAGLGRARLHDSRHAVATQLLAAGIHPGITSAVLGHTDPGFTLRVYSHVLDGMADQAAEALERALGG
jgi:integrase